VNQTWIRLEGTSCVCSNTDLAQSVVMVWPDPGGVILCVVCTPHLLRGGHRCTGGDTTTSFVTQCMLITQTNCTQNGHPEVMRERDRQTDRQFMLEVLIQTYKHTAPMQMVDVACCQCIHHAHPHTHTHTRTHTHTHTLHTASCIQRQVENIGHMRWVLCGGNQRRDG
jgi:hypothetical protein